MKLIATKDFRNVASLRLKDEGETTIEDAIHDDHIHKGAVFSIGPDTLKLNGPDLHKLAKADAGAANVVAMLVHAECVGDATDPKIVEAVKASIKEDEVREANARKLDQASGNQSVVNAVLTALKGMKPA